MSSEKTKTENNNNNNNNTTPSNNELTFKLDLTELSPTNSTSSPNSPSRKKKYGLNLQVKTKKKNPIKESLSSEELPIIQPKASKVSTKKLNSARGSSKDSIYYSWRGNNSKSNIINFEKEDSDPIPLSSDNLSFTSQKSSTDIKFIDDDDDFIFDIKKRSDSNKSENLSPSSLFSSSSSSSIDSVDLREHSPSSPILPSSKSTQKRKSLPKIFSDSMKRKISTKLSSAPTSPSSSSSNLPSTESSSSSSPSPSDQNNDSVDVNQQTSPNTSKESIKLDSKNGENQTSKSSSSSSPSSASSSSSSSSSKKKNSKNMKKKRSLSSSTGASSSSPSLRSSLDSPSSDKEKEKERDVDQSSIILKRSETQRNLEQILNSRPDIDSLINKKIIPNSLSPRSDDDEVEGLEEESIEDKAILLFAEKPHKAIDLLIKHNILENTPQSVAYFLYSKNELSREMIGDYLGDRGDFIAQTLLCYLDHLSFKDMEFDKALRVFLYSFKLPGEAQKIDRIMEAFAKKYYTQYTGNIFAHQDTVYILAYATIMLNTDLHNPYVKKKMTQSEFVNNNRDINQGECLPTAFLNDLYTRILEDEIKTKNVNLFPKSIKCGYLTFKKKNSSRKLWFVLDKDSNHLYSFKFETDTTPFYKYNLKYLSVTHQYIMKKKKVFEIQLGYLEDGRITRFKLITTSQRLWCEWLTKIGDTIEEVKDSDDQ